ncbi:MAG: hypothetical protein IJ105_02730 [Bacilli bacterium]|nr:hypothetical protein [Bacilli bacterium]
MKSRLSKYENNDSLSRVDRNKNLYNDMYENTNYTNMVVIDDSNEIDISKIKEIIDKEKKRVNKHEKNSFDKEEYDSIVPVKTEEKKLYDINEVLKDAKAKRNIIEEANEKRKYQNYKFNENLEEELNKTRKVYENLIKEEKELLNLMNTMTNVSSNTIANDMFQDLTKDDNLTEVLEDITDVGIKQIDNDTTEYSTDTFMFNTKDFEDLDDMRDDVAKSSVFIKILIGLIIIAIIATVAYILFMK